MAARETMTYILAHSLAPILAEVEARLADARARLRSYRGEPTDMGSTEHHCCQRIERARVAELEWMTGRLRAELRAEITKGAVAEIPTIAR